MFRHKFARSLAIPLLAGCIHAALAAAPQLNLLDGFTHPPASARPWVYWFWMDGNSSGEGITADFEAMAAAGIGGVFQMEVDVGVPRGPVAFMSPKWRELFNHAVKEADRLGLKITVNAGPGWTGSGGPWVKPEQSMQKLVFSEAEVHGGTSGTITLPQPSATAGYYKDIAVLAFPTPSGEYRLPDIREKALYHRGHFSSEKGIRSYLPEAAADNLPPAELITSSSIVNLTAAMDTSGTLKWSPPPGKWTVMRFGHTSTGANTRPAPQAGLGLECDKMDRDALSAHYAAYMQPLIDNAGPLAGKSLFSLHIDSWEMGPQNWTAKFPQEFRQRRGYDITPWLPVYAGRVVGEVETSEKFLWDLRRTVQELIVENHGEALKELGRKSGMQLSIEPYDGNPISDMQLGAVADIPMCEFWSNCFSTWFTCYEAASVANTYGRQIVAAEAFTADDAERWLTHPGNMKALGDWAFTRGINRFAFHRYAHQPWLDRAPGMTMGIYGIHYERTQTWWPMVDEYNRYIARCQAVLQQGTAVSDVLYLAPEDAPFVFNPPADAVEGNPPSPRRYNFDCATPEALINNSTIVPADAEEPAGADTSVSQRRKAAAAVPRIQFRNGSSYSALVLPHHKSMTPELLARVNEIAASGVLVIGNPPSGTPGLTGSPDEASHAHAITNVAWDKYPNAIRPGEVTTRSAELPPLPELFANARWVWSVDEPNAATKANAGTQYFRSASIQVAKQENLRSVHFVGTADNSLEVYINGTSAGTHTDFRHAITVDVTKFFRSGLNEVAVAVKNTGEKANPAGFIAAIYIQHDDGTTSTLGTARSWAASSTAASDWTTTSINETWSNAHELGSYPMAPWGQISEPFHEAPLYPSYDLACDALAARGLPPDFEANGGLRYSHRVMNERDVYFVSNPSDEWVQTTALFRVTSCTAEVWDPYTGSTGSAIGIQRFAKRRAVALALEPQGSRFVVFTPLKSDETSPAKVPPELHDKYFVSDLQLADEAAALKQPVTHNSPFIDLVSTGGRQIMWADIYSSQSAPKPFTIYLPWKVSFQPNRGAPESVHLAQLQDLATHSDPKVRHFSGIATYSSKFDLPAQMLDTASVLELDLGAVYVMARVKLNGKVLRTLWKAPYTVDVTNAARAGANDIVVEVANLWPNRLIGDSGLPGNQRIATTTWSPFKPTDQLPPSGLAGPVTLRVGRVSAARH